MGETETIFHRNRNIPSGSGSKAMIAPFWDDLTNGHVFYQYFASDHYFVIEWSDMRNTYNYNFEKFQVILYDPEFSGNLEDDGNIKFQYQEIHNVDQGNQYATVGIENEAQTEGLFITFANIYAPTAHQLTNETAIFITKSAEPQVSANEEIIAIGTQLHHNFPNPFNPDTSIHFTIAEDMEKTELSVYNLKGQKVKTLINTQLSAGRHSVVWSGTNDSNQSVSSGVYLYKLRTEKYHETRKMLLMK